MNEAEEREGACLPASRGELEVLTLNSVDDIELVQSERDAISVSAGEVLLSREGLKRAREISPGVNEQERERRWEPEGRTAEVAAAASPFF